MSLLFERNEYSWMRWRRGVLVSSNSPTSDILILSWYHGRHHGASCLRSVSVIEPDQDDRHVVAAVLAKPGKSFDHNECRVKTWPTYFSTVFLQQVSNNSSQMVLSTSLSLQRNDFTALGSIGFFIIPVSVLNLWFDKVQRFVISNCIPNLNVEKIFEWIQIIQ